MTHPPASTPTLRPIRRHIIHCSASEHGDAATIRQWHLARGWRDIGYHFVIRRDGEIELGRLISEVGAHVAGHNADSLGTCLIGNATFTPAQFASLRRLHGALVQQFPGLTLHGHRDFTRTKTCPNFDVAEVFSK